MTRIVFWSRLEEADGRLLSAGREQERADRILDTAKDLLLRWGYRRIRIDEIAKRSGIGKGTVYLHWRTREQMLAAVGSRETAEMMDAWIDAMRVDPAQVMPHRLMRQIFVEAMGRPVLRAIYTEDRPNSRCPRWGSLPKVHGGREFRRLE